MVARIKREKRKEKRRRKRDVRNSVFRELAWLFSVKSVGRGKEKARSDSRISDHVAISSSVSSCTFVSMIRYDAVHREEHRTRKRERNDRFNSREFSAERMCSYKGPFVIKSRTVLSSVCVWPTGLSRVFVNGGAYFPRVLNLFAYSRSSSRVLS